MPGRDDDAFVTECELQVSETYEGSRREVLDFLEPDDPTVVMPRVVLAQLLAEVEVQAWRELPHTRPTRRSLRAVRPDDRT